MRFSDGAFYEVVLPQLREWHAQKNELIQLNHCEVKVNEIDSGIDSSEKHMDTKLVLLANNDRIVLHTYNGTQNLMIQGKNHENFAVNCLQTHFTEKIDASVNKIDQFNCNVQKMLGPSKPAINQRPGGSKPFLCAECKVKTTTIGDL